MLLILKILASIFLNRFTARVRRDSEIYVQNIVVPYTHMLAHCSNTHYGNIGITYHIFYEDLVLFQ